MYVKVCIYILDVINISKEQKHKKTYKTITNFIPAFFLTGPYP
jgi:hypothetical protein